MPELAAAIDQLSDGRTVYLKYLPYWIDGDVIRLQLRSAPPDWNRIQPSLDLSVLEAQAEEGVAVILHPEDVETLGELGNRLPQGAWFSERMPWGEVAFHVFVAGPAGLVPGKASQRGRGS